MELNKFKECYSLDINLHVEEDYKGLSYLSWATAYKLAMEQDSTMSYSVFQSEDGMPFFSRGEVHIVKTKVTMFGESKEMFLPIMDNKHNSVAKPNSRQVNDNIMRCLAKNIAMFGIGLPLYVGEDLKQFKTAPKEEKVSVKNEEEDRQKAINLITKELKEEDDEFVEQLLSELGKPYLGSCTKEELKHIYTKIKEKK